MSTLATYFLVSNMLDVIPYGMMAFAPQWRATRFLLKTPWIVAPYAIAYLACIVYVLPAFGHALFPAPQLPAVMVFMQDPFAVTATWTHILGYDVFMARWMFLDNEENNIVGRVGMALLLLLCGLAAPLGYLTYVCLRAFVLGKRGVA